jgi:ceramide glucosyltransferase
MWLFREAGAPYLFLHALWNPAIRWRNGEFRLRWGGKAEAVLTRANPADSSSSSSPSPLASKMSSDYCGGGSSGDRSSPPPSYGEAMGSRHHLLPLAVKSVI